MKHSELRDVTDTCRIRIDKEGKWYYEGQEIVNPLVLLTFCNALQKDDQGRYRIVLQSEVCYIDVEDTLCRGLNPRRPENRDPAPPEHG